MDFDGMEEYDFDGKMDFDGMEEYGFDGKIDFDGMEEYDEENRLEPTGESDISQDLDRDTNADNNHDQSSSAEQGNESYENLNSESTSTVLISENREEEGESLQSDDQSHEDLDEITQEELEKEIEKELEEGVEAINHYLEEEAEFINAYQEMVGEARELDGERENEGEERLKTEEEWEKEVETAAFIAEQLYESTNEIEVNANNEELSEINEELEIEKEAEQTEEVLEPQLSGLQEEFEERVNEIEQHQVEPLIEEALETKPEPVVNEKEIQQLQEMEVEEQFQTVYLNEYIEELVEQQEEEKTQEHDKMEQEKEKIEQKQEILHQSTYLQEELEEQEQELELEYEEKDEVEQHQVEAAIEEEFETEPKPIIKEEELEYVKNFELEKQLDSELLYELIEELANKQNDEKEESEGKEDHEEISPEEKVAQIKRKLEIVQEINTSEKEEEELEPDTTFPFKETEEHTEEENKDHQQELEEILEQIGKIEQEALNEIKQKEEDSDKTIERNYEKDKRLYKQQTGKRPIYANQETKGFKQWLKQKKESEDKKKTKEKQDLKEEQKKEEAWKRTLKNRIEGATEIEPELKTELKKLVEKYKELEKLIKKYSQLYNKTQRKELSQTEKIELKSLIKVLQKLDPIKAELFMGIREIKRYIDEHYYYYEYWNNQRNHRVFSHFFTHLAQIYKNFKKAQKKKEKSEEILKNWIEQVSEEEISYELKAELKEIIENYKELDMVAIMFMKLYTKAQNETLSKTEQEKLDSLVRTLQKIDPSKIELFSKIRVIRHYLNDQNLDDFSEKTCVNRVLSHFFKPISQKDLFLKQEMLKLKELINITDDIIQKPRVLVSNRSSLKQYEKPKERIKIKDYGFRLIRYMLREYTHDEISKVIDYRYDSLINKRNKISRPVFNKLMILMNVDEIPHEIYIGNKAKIIISEDEDISELIGIMLGDGNLGLEGSKVAISLNRIDEEMYVRYIRDKLKTVFYDKLSIQSRNSFGIDIKHSKAVEITCFSKNLHYFFVEKGLIPGRKVRNQVNVPDNIFKSRISSIKCVKGLFDTDGNIHVQMKNGDLRLVFTNGSRPLIEDFKRICTNLGIKTGKVLTSFSERNGVQLTSYYVQIASKEHVQNFLRIVDPEKIKEPFRRIYLGTRLILANESADLINIAKIEIQKWNSLNKQKTLIYSKENTIFLRDLCERLFSKKGITEIYGLRFNGKFKDKMFDRALNAALSYAPYQLKLKKSSKDIYHFPLALRNQLCQYLFKILISSSTQLSNHELIELIKQKIYELKSIDMYEASTSFIYGRSITNYFKSLIFLIRYLIHLSKSSTPVVAKQVFDDIDNNPNWNQVHSYDMVREIIYHLIKTFPAHLNIKEIESNKIIEHLKIKGTATKQEIAKLIGKGLRAAYNKLIELEKKGIVKRNREKIGDPTFWSLAL